MAASKRRSSRRARPGAVEHLETRLVLSPLIWGTGPALPAAEAQTAAATANGATYLFGGGSNAVRALVDGANAWGAVAPDDSARQSPGAGTIGAGLVVFGGNDGGALNATLNYDPTDENTVAGGNLNTARWREAYATDANGSIYAIGGESAGGTALSSVERYNGATWTTVQPLPAALIGAAAADDGAGHIFVFGGISSTSAAPSGAVYEYTVASDSWTTVASLPTPVAYAAAAPGFNGNIYVLGGSTTPGGSSAGDTAAVQLYNITTNTWTNDTALPQAISAESAIVDPLGRLLVIGGTNSAGQAVADVSISQRLNVPVAAPVFTSTPITAAAADKVYTYTATASANPPASFSLVSGPAGMTINPVNGQVNWQPLASQAGMQSVDIQATNAIGSSDQTYTINTKLESVPPSLPTNFHLISATTNSLTLGWTASTDPYGVAGYRIYYTYGHSGRGGGYTTVLLLDHPGTATTATLSGLTSGKSYNLSISAYNASGYASARAGSLFATTYKLPTVFVPASPVTATANHALSFYASGSGIPAPTVVLQNNPGGMNYDPTTGKVTWTPTPAQVGSYSVTAVATSAAGTASANFTVNVGADIPMLSYQVNGSSGPNYGLVGIPMTIQVFNSSLTPTTYSLISGPAGLNIDTNTGLMTFTPAEADAGLDTVVIRGTNAVGQADLTATFQTYITPAVTNITTSDTTLLTPTISWTAPTGMNDANIAGYTITLQGYNGYSYVTNTFDTKSPATSLNLTDLAIGLYYYQPTITSYDAAGRIGFSATGPTFTYAPNIPKIGYTGMPAQTVVGQPLNLTLTNSNTSLPVTFGLSSGPGGITVDPKTGVVNWIPTASQEGTQTATFSATNSVGSVTEAITLGVRPFSGPTALSYNYLSATSFNVSWQPPALNAGQVAGYHVTVFVGNTNAVYTVPAGSLNLPVSASAPGYVYVIWVSAFDSSGLDGLASTLDVPFPSDGLASATLSNGVQRSEMRNITLQFNKAVALAAGAVTMGAYSGNDTTTAISDASAALGTPTSSDGGFTWVIPVLANTAFSDSTGSLNDGIYKATLHWSLVAGASNTAIGGGDQSIIFHRLFGDIDGNGTVNSADFFKFKTAFGSTLGQSSFNSNFDFDQNGKINSSDYFKFKSNFGKHFSY